MDTAGLEKIAKQLVAPGKGVLAADESNASCEKRFVALGLECTEASRREYRQILVATPGIESSLSGIIFFDETFWQSTDEGKEFRATVQEKGILAGIKVDQGLIDMPGFKGEKLSQGLDSLPERIKNYADNGASFAKWRSVIAIGDGIPTTESIEANSFILSRYARVCQDAGIVPIVEPEILFDGTHSIDTCETVMAKTLGILFDIMKSMRVYMPGAILKTSMVLPGKNSGHEVVPEDTANRTVKVLHENVPTNLGGIVFLSGGQTPESAFKNLSLIAQKGPHPWGVTFSYSRALQDPVLKAWAGNDGEPQAVYIKQLATAVAATKGELKEPTGNDNFVSQSQDL